MGWKLRKTLDNWKLWAEDRERMWASLRYRELWHDIPHAFINMLKGGIQSHAYGLAHVLGISLVIAGIILFAWAVEQIAVPGA